MLTELESKLFKFLDAQKLTLEEVNKLGYLANKVSDFEKEFLDRELEIGELYDLVTKYNAYYKSKILS